MESYRPFVAGPGEIDESGERQRCGNCRFWLSDRPDESGGACRFDPPRVVSETSALSPSTASDSWCGKWERRDDPALYDDEPFDGA